MDISTRTNLDNLHSTDKELRSHAFISLVEATDTPVDWAYDVWDEMLAMMRQGDNHQRAIAAQLLANLAKSDPEQRMLRDFPALLAVTRDERFVTARHCMQSIWKVGATGKEQQEKLLAGLEVRFLECTTEKNCTLIRYDIIQAIRKLYDVVNEEGIRDAALALIATEGDLKYRAKYASLWKR